MTTSTTPAAEAVREAFELWYVGHMKREANLNATPDEIKAMRKNDGYGDRGYLNGAWCSFRDATASESALKQQHALELLSLEGQAMERECALIAERDQLRAAMRICLTNVQAADRDKPFSDPDMWGEMVSIRLTGLVALVNALEPNARESVLQAFIDRTAALAAPAVEGE
jgi:hypothetical protein